MNDRELLALLSRILGELLLDDGVVLTMTTRRSDVPGWDSFAYVNFIVAVELELGIKFTVSDVESFDTVADIVAHVKAMAVS